MSGPLGLPLPLLTDSYKASHFAIYPPAKQATAYGEFRSGFKHDTKDTRIVFYGLRYVLETYISKPWTRQDVKMAEAFFARHNAGFTPYPFPKALFDKFVGENGGYFPVTIEALAEGSVVYPHVPVYQITAKEPYTPLITYLETVLLMTWYPTTVATLSRRTRTTIERAYETSVDSKAMWTLDSRMHDFGFRACTCVEQSVLGGTAHLLNYQGSDTLSAAFYAQYQLNNGDPVATSIPATEHSVMMSHASDREAVLGTIAAYGDGVYACVMDSFDYARALAEVLPAVKQKKLERGGFLVIRPDSGDQVEAVLLGLRAADKVFGSARNSKGYKVISGASVIQGDGVTPESLERILAAVLDAGFSAQCIGFGMGGGLLQKVNRDTLSAAVKISQIIGVDGIKRDIMKFPKEEAEKTSLPGRFAVHADPAQNGAPDSPNLLQVVYDCGPVPGLQWLCFDDLRARIRQQWDRFPVTAQAVSPQLLEHQQKVLKRQREKVDQGTVFQ
ncbi:nicotinamide phosphoribosyltransferase [Linderina pennispora]|uniref:Nicotinamide phosphoribosyltransferase n=1 Tax=Linderina pennispora TaxID=61395 RepID=A0A1Y1WBH8_9FUNG|nr:nicotinamide phosphoribosyltransferase [Linderina pennispora]ORX70899.1 nicotinamide phosphoribosyltransferase [Linderina pennispora]